MDREARKKEIVSLLQRAADGREHISLPEFVRVSEISKHEIHKHFPDGGYTELLRLAGLSVHPQRQSRTVTDDDVLAEFNRISIDIGTLPTWPQIEARTKLTRTMIRNRFGSKEKLLCAYKGWLERHDPTSFLLAAIDAELLAESGLNREHVELRMESSNSCPPRPGLVYGEILNFRGLRHAPINEQGVVYLFGMVSHELGFLIEAVQTGFPDCHGKRRVKGNRWQPVRIEFEYQSRNFLVHGHDAALCDLVVCWEHNWPECPIEVLCLKERIRELKSTLE